MTHDEKCELPETTGGCEPPRLCMCAERAIAALRAELRAALLNITGLHDEVERLRGSLAVCGVIARGGPGAYLPEYECDSIQAVAAVVAENERLRAQLAALAEAGTGYSQQTVDAITKERERLRAYLPLARACARVCGGMVSGDGEELMAEWWRLAPEQRAWLLEDKP